MSRNHSIRQIVLLRHISAVWLLKRWLDWPIFQGCCSPYMKPNDPLEVDYIAWNDELTDSHNAY